ncbi:MAG TPA: uracil-DNA glycosylase [Rhodocyclaceae bacterium]|nr:uracil-DNA glycosylase [Rhodocyclaceae bacterium]
MLSQQEILAEMGVKPMWRLRAETEQPAEARAVAADAASPAPGEETDSIRAPGSAAMAASPAPVALSGDVATMDWPQLAEAVAACRACTLCEQRKQAVLGVGDPQADWLFIGEGPGAEEDERGEPFVGQAGKLLDNMLAALDLNRHQRVYIGNTVKCRPPGNRTPSADEMSACRPYLERQIALIQPKIIVLLGKAAVHSVLGEDKSLAAMRGKRYEYAGIPVVVTYHPAYLLRSLPEKAKAWEDLLFARRTLLTGTTDELF